jgi:hypothetical protein
MDDKLRKLPLGIQYFGKLRSSNCLYVGKTAYAYQLVTQGGNLVFY